ncbi:hypothetical protein SAMN05443639_105285 [Stigmatella erecta]|uniref:Uncharacterized protein n=1 Tax=Stigmatella erecta TaxID=83460 RepID=A0A1I0I404_9BACT|nr:hypothetical protein SAMN05443639_105285 [Stigmatella erecta]
MNQNNTYSISTRDSVPADWWIDDLAVGPQRIGCDVTP